MNQNQEKGAPTLYKKGLIQGMAAQENLPKMQEKKNTMKAKKDMGRCCEFHKSSTHNTSDCQAK